MNTIELILENVVQNQMRIIQSLNIHRNLNIIIEVPFNSLCTQYHLIGMQDTNKRKSKKRKSAHSFYDGFQLYSSFPVIKSFKKKYKQGPNYDQLRTKLDDKSFAYNLVTSNIKQMKSQSHDSHNDSHNDSDNNLDNNSHNDDSYTADSNEESHMQSYESEQDTYE